MSGAPGSDAPSVYNTSSAEKAGPPPPVAAAATTTAVAAKTPDTLPADTAWMDHEDKSVAVTLPAPAPDAPAAPVVAASSSADADVTRRIDRLEKEVAEMHNDMNMMMPALTKLVSAQQDLQQILARMDTAAGTPRAPIADTGADNEAAPGNPRTIGTEQPVATAAPAAAAPPMNTTIEMGPPKAAPLAHDDVPSPGEAMPAPAASAPPADGPVPPAPAHPAAYSVSQVRFGEHNNMTRMVLDASGKVPYTYALDGSGTLMTLHLPQTDWRTASSSVPATSKLVDSYTATPDGQGGYMVAVRLKQPVAVSWADVMPPGSEGGYRVVFDLTPKS
jgi:hypothetical protein